MDYRKPHRSFSWIIGCVLSVGCSHHEESGHAGASTSANTPGVSSPSAAANKLLDVGESAPRFTALAHTGMRFELGQFIGLHPSLVHFCPTLSSPSCEKAMTALRDDWFHLRERLGMAIFVFPDDEIKLREFAYEHEYPFLLVSDAEGSLARSFGVGVSGPSAPVGFLIGTDGKIAKRFADPGDAYVDTLKAATTPGASAQTTPAPAPSVVPSAR